MTDLDNFKVMLNSWGVPHKAYAPYDDDNESIASTIKVGGYAHQSDPRKTVTGYRGFYTLFNFDEGGKFIRMGAWE